MPVIVRKLLTAWFVIVVWCCASQRDGSADTFRLSSGDEIEGRLLNTDERPRKTYRIRLTTGGDVTLDAEDVARVIPPSPNKQRYLDLLKQMPSDTAKMHWIMAEQCEKLRLTKERKLHLERVIKLDPNHEEARKALGYKKTSDGKWATLEQIKAAEGKVRWKGQWLTQAEIERREAAGKRKEAKLEWQRKLRMWKKWLKDPRRRSKAVEEIASIEDPLADEALIKMFWSETSVPLRELLAEVMGQLPSGRATTALAQAAMQGDSESENEIRLHSIRQLKKNKRFSVVPGFVSQLRSKDNTAVRRAGYALGELGDDAVTLPLIKAIRTKHTTLVGGAGNGGINMRNGGLSVGRTKPKKVDKVVKNPEVLSALVKITGKDRGGYNQQEWLAWYRRRSTPPNLDLRRDP